MLIPTYFILPSLPVLKWAKTEHHTHKVCVLTATPKAVTHHHDSFLREELGMRVILELTFQAMFLISAVQKQYHGDFSFQVKQDKGTYIK